MADLDPGQARPQPFAHLSAPNAALYREVLCSFARAKERFIVHLRPEDVAAELRREGDERLAQALDKLVEWGNLRADADTGRVTTVEDFHRKRFLYQLTAAGHAAEQAIAFYEEAIGQRGVLQSVALADIADQLAALSALAAETDPDPAKVHLLLLLALADRFSSLADNAQAFMASLRRAIDFSDGDVEGFIAYKERLIDYINRFIADLANSGAHIARLLGEAEARGHERLLGLAARREASDAVPEGADAAEAFGRAEAAALESWRNRWRGLRDWFVSGGTDRPIAGAAAAPVGGDGDQAAPRHGGAAERAPLGPVGPVGGLPGAGPLVRRGTGRGGDAPAVAGGVRALVRAAPHRHGRDAGGVGGGGPQGAPWADAPPVRISPQLRRTGSYERRGKPNRVQDRTEMRQLLRERADREAAEAAAARARLRTGGPVLLSELGRAGRTGRRSRRPLMQVRDLDEVLGPAEHTVLGHDAHLPAAGNQ